MQKVETKQPKIFPKTMRMFVFLSLFLFAGLLSACFGGGAAETPATMVMGHTTVLGTGTTATLTCSAECADTAQCGDSTERGKVVLLNSAAPKTENHDIAANDQSTVTIVGTQDETMKHMATNTTFLLKYYAVTIPEREGAAWVAGFCIQGTPAQ